MLKEDWKVGVKNREQGFSWVMMMMIVKKKKKKNKAGEKQRT